MAESSIDQPEALQVPPATEPPTTPVPAHIAAAYERRKTLAVFSTKHGLRPPRSKLADQPMQLRSEGLSSKEEMTKRLRANFPEECVTLPPVGTFPVGILLEYWDPFDIQFYGSKWLLELFESMSYQNQLDRAARAGNVLVFVNEWIENNRQAFHMMNGDHRWPHLFLPETIERYGVPFVWDAFWKIAEIRENHGTLQSPALCVELTSDAQDNGERLRLATQAHTIRSLQPAQDRISRRHPNRPDMVEASSSLQGPHIKIHDAMLPPAMLHSHPMHDHMYFVDPMANEIKEMRKFP